MMLNVSVIKSGADKPTRKGGEANLKIVKSSERVDFTTQNHKCSKRI